MKTIFASFDNYASSRDAVNALLDEDFSLAEMNALVLADVAKREMETNQAKVHVNVTDEVGDVALHGLDRLVGGEQPVQAPQVGQVYAAGELATLLVNQFAGAGGNSFTDILQEFGVPSDAAAHYASAINGGGVIFWVRSDDARASQAATTLRDRGAQHVFTNQPR